MISKALELTLPGNLLTKSVFYLGQSQTIEGKYFIILLKVHEWNKVQRNFFLKHFGQDINGDREITKNIGNKSSLFQNCRIFIKADWLFTIIDEILPLLQNRRLVSFEHSRWSLWFLHNNNKNKCLLRSIRQEQRENDLRPNFQSFNVDSPRLLKLLLTTLIIH